MNFSDIKIDKIYSAFQLQRIKGDTRTTVNRNTAGIVIIKNGRISYCQSDNEVIQTADVAVILPKDITYSLYCHDDAFCYLINFDEYTNIMGRKIQTVKVAHKNKVVEKVEKMCQIWSMRENSYILIAMSLMYSILADMNSYLSMNKEQRKLYELIKPSIKFIEENFSNYDIKNDELAKISNISTVYFRKIFTNLYGIPPIHYIEIRKIERAKELLNSDEFTITEVAMASGFKDIYHFCRAFKKITGFSPTNYRKEFLK